MEQTEQAPAQDSTKPPSLVSKLAAIMALVERIPKRGRNEFHKYDYATEADIAATVRQELAARHVMLIPSIVGEERVSVGEKGSWLTILHMEMEFVDGETGESIIKPWRGYGTDKEDKGGYKAMTGAEKHFLLKTFLMPTGDDPEADGAKASKRTSRPREDQPPLTRDPNDTRPISEAQVNRLRAIMRTAGIDDKTGGALMRPKYDYKKWSDIQRKDYDAIVALMQAGAPTPAPMTAADIPF